MEKHSKSQLEFIALMASLMSLVALAIDALLPALGIIGDTIGITDTNDNQLLVTMIFLGLGIGQLLSGPLSDSFGRKPVIYFGFSLFIIASIICTTAPSLEIMILGRILQGIGLSAPRTISVAIVRDSFSGDYMAKIMSFVTVIFILVPAIAPALGKFLLDTMGWRSIFYTQIAISVIVVIWFAIRQKETLKPENKVKFNIKLFSQGTKEFFKYKQAVVNTLILGFVTASFLVFLSTAQKIFGEQYGMTDEFPYLFAAIALTVGISTFLNGSYVVKYGMKKMVIISSVFFTLVPLVYLILFYSSSNPGVYTLLGFFVLQFFTFGFLFGNLSALAMEPLGHIAGIGSAISGFVSTIIAVPIAALIGSFMDTTALPLFAGFFITGLISIVFVQYCRATESTGTHFEFSK
ncbi:Bcr/CflA family efflux MFS transporter [Leptobacterium flavescens]|uniref:Bcr/CflA family efflux MFS transporter n=1 Tax=Leptobacterium flavescens TaxID=472055 RepID=A0A6P0UU90_9FLAO|nr:multidrug effflux MFS transporter [Leptobacterium flavescens]NER15399.1 Bcr/CflA family efflux MFS transporter [Leptobacterium flavescens]